MTALSTTSPQAAGALQETAADFAGGRSLGRLQVFAGWARDALIDLLILGLATVAFKISFQALSEVVVRIGAVSASNGPYMAVLIDGFIVTVTLIARARHHDGERGWTVGYPFLLVAFAAAVSMLANAAHAADNLGAQVLAMLPPLLLFLAVELRSAELRRRRQRRTNRTAPADPPSPPIPPAATWDPTPHHSRGISVVAPMAQDPRTQPRPHPAPESGSQARIPQPAARMGGRDPAAARPPAPSATAGRTGTGKQANRLRVRALLAEHGNDLDWPAVVNATGLSERRARELINEERAAMLAAAGDPPTAAANGAKHHNQTDDLH